MNEQQLAAVKQALGALEGMDILFSPLSRDCTQYNAVDKAREAITALQSIISQDALYKMAEDAVTIGLSYNDWPKIGCVNHDCDQCKAVQSAERGEPVAWIITFEKQNGDRETCALMGRYKDVRDVCDFGDPIPLYTTPPAAQKPWAWLTKEDVESWDLPVNPTVFEFVQFIEAKIKAKNERKEKNNA